MNKQGGKQGAAAIGVVKIGKRFDALIHTEENYKNFLYD